MEWTPKLFFFLILGTLFTFFIVDISYQSFVTGDVSKSIENAGKGAMQQSINKGTLRVEEDMSIDTERYKDFYVNLYEKNKSVRNSSQVTKFQESNEMPPMAAMQANGSTSSYFLRAMKLPERVTANKKEIVIIEKKN